MPIKAYHYVPEAAIDRVIAHGEIVPASERIDPSLFIWDCQNTVNEVRSEMAAEGREIDETALDALHDWIESEINALHDWQRSIAAEYQHRESQFLCIDLLAGDLDRVFLSIGNWVHWANPSGLVFDAEALIKKGAGLRRLDLAGDYLQAVQDVLARPWRARAVARAALGRAIRLMEKENTFYGAAARRTLRSLEKAAARYERREDGKEEIVFPGSLPVAWATEVWKSGRRVA